MSDRTNVDVVTNEELAAFLEQPLDELGMFHTAAYRIRQLVQLYEAECKVHEQTKASLEGFREEHAKRCNDLQKMTRGLSDCQRALADVTGERDAMQTLIDKFREHPPLVLGAQSGLTVCSACGATVMSDYRLEHDPTCPWAEFTTATLGE